MVVLVSVWRLRLPEARSLKDKRMVIRSLKDRIRRLNVSVAETGSQDQWGSAEISVALVAPHRAFADSVVSKLDSLIEGEPRVVIVGFDRFEA